eukprot:jgi/Psemu1/463/gm1.463_g
MNVHAPKWTGSFCRAITTSCRHNAQTLARKSYKDDKRNKQIPDSSPGTVLIMENENLNSKNKYKLHKDYQQKNTPDDGGIKTLSANTIIAIIRFLLTTNEIAKGHIAVLIEPTIFWYWHYSDKTWKQIRSSQIKTPHWAFKKNWLQYKVTENYDTNDANDVAEAAANELASTEDPLVNILQQQATTLVANQAGNKTTANNKNHDNATASVLALPWNPNTLPADEQGRYFYIPSKGAARNDTIVQQNYFIHNLGNKSREAARDKLFVSGFPKLGNETAPQVCKWYREVTAHIQQPHIYIHPYFLNRRDAEHIRGFTVGDKFPLNICLLFVRSNLMHWVCFVFPNLFSPQARHPPYDDLASGDGSPSNWSSKIVGLGSLFYSTAIATADSTPVVSVSSANHHGGLGVGFGVRVRVPVDPKRKTGNNDSDTTYPGIAIRADASVLATLSRRPRTFSAAAANPDIGATGDEDARLLRSQSRQHGAATKGLARTGQNRAAKGGSPGNGEAGGRTVLQTETGERRSHSSLRKGHQSALHGAGGNAHGRDPRRRLQESPPDIEAEINIDTASTTTMSSSASSASSISVLTNPNDFDSHDDTNSIMTAATRAAATATAIATGNENAAALQPPHPIPCVGRSTVHPVSLDASVSCGNATTEPESTVTDETRNTNTKHEQAWQDNNRPRGLHVLYFASVHVIGEFSSRSIFVVCSYTFRQNAFGNEPELDDPTEFHHHSEPNLGSSIACRTVLMKKASPLPSTPGKSSLLVLGTENKLSMIDRAFKLLGCWTAPRSITWSKQRVLGAPVFRQEALPFPDRFSPPRGRPPGSCSSAVVHLREEDTQASDKGLDVALFGAMMMPRSARKVTRLPDKKCHHAYYTTANIEMILNNTYQDMKDSHCGGADPRIYDWNKHNKKQRFVWDFINSISNEQLDSAKNDDAIDGTRAVCQRSFNKCALLFSSNLGLKKLANTCDKCNTCSMSALGSMNQAAKKQERFSGKLEETKKHPPLDTAHSIPFQSSHIYNTCNMKLIPRRRVIDFVVQYTQVTETQPADDVVVSNHSLTRPPSQPLATQGSLPYTNYKNPPKLRIDRPSGLEEKSFNNGNNGSTRKGKGQKSTSYGVVATIVAAVKARGATRTSKGG